MSYPKIKISRLLCRYVSGGKGGEGKLIAFLSAKAALDVTATIALSTVDVHKINGGENMIATALPIIAALTALTVGGGSRLQILWLS